MPRFRLFAFSFITASSVLLSGCVVRTYQKEVPRVDTEISGNGGYLVGGPSQTSNYDSAQKTRKIFVTEIELKRPEDKEDKEDMASADAPEPASEPNTYFMQSGSSTSTVYSEEASGPIAQKASPSAPETMEKYETYVVQKNDTLQKISYKFYGTHKKWQKIYEANKDRLENPDSLFVGQKLLVPVEE